MASYTKSEIEKLAMYFGEKVSTLEKEVGTDDVGIAKNRGLTDKEYRLISYTGARFLIDEMLAKYHS